MPRFRSWFAPLVLAFAIAALTPVAALGANGYRTTNGVGGAGDPDAIDVVEFFWYGCPHCYRFESFIKGWLENKPDDVRFRYIPTVFSPTWAFHGRAFYAAKLMGVLDRFHSAMFNAIHAQGRSLDTPEELHAFVASLGIDADKFLATMQSFAVDAKMRQAKQLQRAYGIAGTPTVVIEGRYVTSGTIAGSFERVIEVIKDRVAAVRGGSG